LFDKEGHLFHYSFMNQDPDIPKPINLIESDSDYELNEAEDLRLEESRAKYDARMEELDRRDAMGPHYRWRS
jgi:hypothetical protein